MLYNYPYVNVRRTLSTPLGTMGGVGSERGQPSRKISTPARDFFKPARKQKQKNIALAFVKAA
jgi:hypothetical protein